MTDQHEWLEKLTAPLPEEKIRARVNDDNPHWEFIDGEMVKLGALSHSTLNLTEIQQRILTLLSSESKDFRLVVHLLRTLQHAGQPQDIILALQLLCTWVREYWELAWPDNLVMKRRLAQQVMKRFSSAANIFIERADHEHRQAVLGELAHLAQLWQGAEKELAKEADALGVVYRRQPERAPVEAAGPGTAAQPVQPVTFSPAVAPAPVVDIDDSGEKAWRHSQLRMAEILCERQPDNPLGYRLRRNAVWQGINSAPLAQADGRTPLAAFSADRMAEYLGGATNPDHALWEQVEQSLTLAPYWFEGHRISAGIARKLGYERVAEAIREELGLFLQRLPQLSELSFNDRTPFLSASTQDWLSDAPAQETTSATTVRLVQSDIDNEAVWQCWREQGLEAALGKIDAQAQQQTPRGRFYCQLLGARLLEDAGMAALAQQSYRHLYQVAQGITLPDWEPDLITQLEEQHMNSEG
ncbi:type VI secretion system protein TssA [Enterobacillus tribolii]|uniref:Type VI secretion system protein VasJ n=1 Tax=Enterobacillus tribolii TaxID=1487935 RepID=A0A370QHB1_9GAMM|nr:type VI secretion system protein TssA [Enterobacillus tribolii]MBW7982465.1 type VI secretion system protein TssA [Enterobacillus tribolii]RDK87744.1 type VI secretion system protein VasJ [Enterobacillus tribolii]